MRIAYDNQIFCWQPYGGISRYFYEIAKGISCTPGAEVTVFCPLYVNNYLVNRPESLRLKGINIPLIPRGGRLYRAIGSPLTRYWLNKYKPAVVHETYYANRRLAPAMSKVVLTVFDMIHEKFSNNYSSFDPTAIEKANAVSRADHIICISENTRRDVIEILKVPPEKTSVVYLASSLGRPTATVGSGTGKPFLLYVGSRFGYKNFSGLLAAYSRSMLLKKDFDLVCFGGGAFNDEERALMLELGIPANNVQYLAGNDDFLASLYSKAAVFVYPSKYEGFGLPPLEAMSTGCPVVCSNSSSLPEVVGDAAELFDPYDEDQLRTSLEKVVTLENLRKDLGERGSRRAATFSWDRCAEETLAIYKIMSPGHA